MTSRLVYSLLNQFLLVIIMFGSAAILGRLIEPSVFGIFALLFAIHSLLFPIVDFGLTPVYIKLDIITSETKNVFFTLNIILGLIYSVLFLMITPFINQNNFFIYSLLFILSVIIVSFNQQPLANLARDNNQKTIMIITFLSTFLSAIIAMIMAYYNFGIYALIIQVVIQPLILNILLRFTIPYKYEFANFNSIKKYKNEIILSSHILGSRITNGISLSYDKFLIGKFFNMDVLGFYSKSFQLVRFPDANISTALGSPIYSYLARKTKEESKFLYSYIGNFIFFISGNLSIFLIVYGDWAIIFLLGKQWIGAAIYIKLLGIWGIGKVLHGILIIFYTNEKIMNIFTKYSIIALVINAIVFILSYYLFDDIITTIMYFSISNLVVWGILYMYSMYRYS
ncbi:MAG TPA: hypothetical protein EYM48_07840, partial [Campylobacterales bacterium]|nr:hypothetical protein [Campylobacterales bacterium]